MSGSSTPNAATGQPKQLSSRLLTMKFMQRAAASLPNQSTASSSHTPASGPPSKRRRVDVQSQPSTPSPPVRTPNQTTTTPASKAEQDVQSRARNLREEYETEWVLKINLPHTKTPASRVNRYRDEEDEDEDDDDDIWATQTVGRQTYGSFKRKGAQTIAADTGKEVGEMSSASDSEESTSSFESKKAPAHCQSRNADRARTSQAPRKSAQAPSRFFDQISLDAEPAKNTTSAKHSNKKLHHRKKPRATI